MRYVKKGYGWLACLVAGVLVWFCGVVRWEVPAWAEEAARVSEQLETLKALNEKVDVLIKTLERDGRVFFNRSVTEELERLGKVIDDNLAQTSGAGTNPQQATLSKNSDQPHKQNPHQPRLQ